MSSMINVKVIRGNKGVSDVVLKEMPGTVAELKEKLASLLSVSLANQRILCNNHMSPDQANLPTDRNGITAVIKNESSKYCVRSLDVTADFKLKHMIDTSQEGIDKHHILSRLDNSLGTSGVFKVRDIHRNVCAIFKPQDEEQGMECNPNKEYRQIMEEYNHFRPGDGCQREAAAYIIDAACDHYFSIPPTTLALVAHPCLTDANGNNTIKFGSLQEFVSNAESWEDYSVDVYDDLMVQRLALFDLMTLNYDRNEGNILVVRDYKQVNGLSSGSSMSPYSFSRGHDDDDDRARLDEDDDDGTHLQLFSSESYDSKSLNLTIGLSRSSSSFSSSSSSDMKLSLVPIDHSFILPDIVKITRYSWCWLDCRQVCLPALPALLNMLQGFDVNGIVTKLSSMLFLPKSCYVIFRFMYYFIVLSLSLGLSMNEVAKLVISSSSSDGRNEIMVDEFGLDVIELLPPSLVSSSSSSCSPIELIVNSALMMTTGKNRLTSNLNLVIDVSWHDNDDDDEMDSRTGFLPPSPFGSSMIESSSDRAVHEDTTEPIEELSLAGDEEDEEIRYRMMIKRANELVTSLCHVLGRGLAVYGTKNKLFG